MKNYFAFIFVLLIMIPLSVVRAQQKVVTINPQRPERGQQVTITYHADAEQAKIPPGAEKVQLVFTYSTLFELPYTINLRRRGNDWFTSFTVPRYATLATFYFKSGDTIDKPSATRHYELIIYNDKGRVKNGYLYEAYSLPAQMGHVDSLGIKQEQLYREELRHYPHNYEAQLRLLKYKINHARQKDKKALLDTANGIIAQRFMKAPTEMDNLNKVTMGYLILGEKSRLDSIRKVVVQRYPHSGPGIEFLASFAAGEKDTAKRISILENALKDENKENEESFSGIHEMLFDYYVLHHNREKALYHARKMAAVKDPYLPSTLKSIAEDLTANDLALDTARKYAMDALQAADSFPIGIIRYFPEFGYIPSYTDDSTKEAVINGVKGSLVSLMGIIDAKQQRPAEAEKDAVIAEAFSGDKGTLQHTAHIYEMINKPGRAFEAYKKILLLSPSDSASLAGLKENYIRYHGSEAGYDTVIAALEQVWKKKMIAVLNKQRIHKKLPEIRHIVDMKGKPFDRQTLANKVVVMDFWATWCVPCMHELPYIQKVYDKFKDNPGVIFMITNSGANNTLKDAQKWTERQNYTFPVYYTNDPKLGDKLGFNVIPALFVIDKKGNIQFKTIGFEGPDIESKLTLEIEMLLHDEN